MDFKPFVEQAEARLGDVEGAMNSFDFAADGQDRFRSLSREHQRLSRLLERWNSLQRCCREAADSAEMLADETDPEMQAMIEEEVARLEAEAGRAETSLKALILPPRDYEDRNIILEIRPAAGGDEASLFAGDLYRMYSRYAESRGWKAEVLELSETEVGGVKEVSVSLQGEEVFRYLAFESGVHRVQRIPVTESGGRIHTSTVTVAVLPEAEDVDVEIRSEDLRMDVFRASGPGGQSVNTTDSAVRITHIPTGVSVACQQEKSQHRNRETAMRILRSRLLEAKLAEEAAKNAAARRLQVGSGDRSERIRTYNFPQNRVSDHRFGITLYSLGSILEGDLDELLATVAERDVERRLDEELAAVTAKGAES